MLRVKLKVAATVPVVSEGKTVRHDWTPAGSEVDLPEEDFSPEVHEELGKEGEPKRADAPPGPAGAAPKTKIQPVGKKS